MTDKPEEGTERYQRELTRSDIEAIEEIKRLAAYFDSMGELHEGDASPDPMWIASPPALLVSPPPWLFRTHGELKRPAP
jgi:hypothetical protein